MKYLVALWLALLSTSSYAIDLREYFPDSNTVYLHRDDGSEFSRYTFIKSPSGYSSLYTSLLNQNKPGYHYIWRKEYMKNGLWVKATDAVLFMGDDMSVTEAGDWYQHTSGGIAIGYKTSSGVNTGLVWSTAGGLQEGPYINEMQVWQQNYNGAAYAYHGYDAYSKTGLIEILPTYTPPFGRNASGVWGGGRTYNDVIHIVMYHGTKSATSPQIRCPNSPVEAYGAYYQSFKDYNSYAIELYLAKGIGIIQETTTFIEDGAYWGKPNCTGEIFSPQYSYSSFIAE